MPEQIFNSKWGQAASVTIMLACIALYAYSGSYLFLGMPFALLFLLLMSINWKTAYWILLFSIPVSMQLFFFGDTLSAALPDEPLMWLFLLLFVLLFAHNPRVLPEWFWRNKLTLIVALQFIWLIVAVTFSNETLISIKFLIAKAWVLISFFILPILVFKEKKDFKKGFWLFLVPMVFTALIIFYRHAGFGFKFRKIEKAIAGIYYNHVDYSTVLSMFLPVMAVALGLMKGYKRYLRWVMLLCILFILAAVYFTFARAAMLALVFSFVIYVGIRLRMVNLVMPLFFAGVIAVVFYVVRNDKYLDYRPQYEKTFTQVTFEDLIVATFRGQDMSSMERLYRWIGAVRMSQDRPLTGYGPNSFYYYYKPHTVSMFRTYVSRNLEQSTTHNYFLFMLVGQGWPALILYGLLVMAVFAQAQKTYHRFKDRFYKKLTLAMAMMFAAGFINNFFSELIETHKVGALFYLSISLLIVLDRKSRKEEDGMKLN